MKKWLIFCLFCCFYQTSYAKNPPLRVAVAAFSPPFVMRSADQSFYGFDVATVEYVCEKLERRCEYIPMPFDSLLPTLEAGKADVAIGGIIITLKRSDLVQFSTPYLVSKGQFIGTRAANIKPPFEITQLSGKNVGILRDGSFERTVRAMGKKKPRLIAFDQDNDLIHALNTNEVSIALLSLPKARYWQSNTSGTFETIGKPFPVGFGFAIAINPAELPLVKKINLALFDYQNSDAFKKNYNLYLSDGF